VGPEGYPVNYGITEVLARTSSGGLQSNLLLEARLLMKLKKVSHGFVCQAMKTVQARESSTFLGRLFHWRTARFLVKLLLSCC